LWHLHGQARLPTNLKSASQGSKARSAGVSPVNKVSPERLRIAEKGDHEEHEVHEGGYILPSFAPFVSFVVLSP
jgi:hypothetical protein